MSVDIYVKSDCQLICIIYLQIRPPESFEVNAIKLFLSMAKGAFIRGRLDNAMIQNINQNFLDNVKRYAKPKIGFVFIFLILLQSILVPLISANLPSTDFEKSADLSYFYIMSSYTLIVLGILIFQAHGIELLSDHFSLWLILLTCFLRFNLNGYMDTMS
jgi:hypothetical protein